MNVYLDYNSTTPVDPKVLEEMLPFFTNEFGNAASNTHMQGRAASVKVDNSRKIIAGILNCEPQEIIFTSGATEALNLAIKGVYEAYASKGNHIISAKTEHKAVLDTLKYLETKGASITLLDVDRFGMIDPDALKSAITPQTILVCIMYANNETGVIQDIPQLAGIAHEHGALFLSDTTQAFGKTRIDVQDSGIDLCTLSAHKFYGPKGIGALYVRRKGPRVTLLPQIHGGGHERGLRSGTLNVPGIAGMAKAFQIAEDLLWEESTRLSAIRTYFEQAITDTGKAMINGSLKNRLCNTTNICFREIRSNKFITSLPQLSIASGSACTSALPEASHVLKAMGLTEEEAHSSIRFSLGRYTTKTEVDFALQKILHILLPAI